MASCPSCTLQPRLDRPGSETDSKTRKATRQHPPSEESARVILLLAQYGYSSFGTVWVKAAPRGPTDVCSHCSGYRVGSPKSSIIYQETKLRVHQTLRSTATIRNGDNVLPAWASSPHDWNQGPCHPVQYDSPSLRVTPPGALPDQVQGALGHTS